MTDEEANDLEQAMWGNVEDAKFGDKDEVLKMFVYPHDGKYRPGFDIYVLAINWLRKYHFDVDYLIKDGIALDKTIFKTLH